MFFFVFWYNFNVLSLIIHCRNKNLFFSFIYLGHPTHSWSLLTDSKCCIMWDSPLKGICVWRKCGSLFGQSFVYKPFDWLISDKFVTLIRAANYSIDEMLTQWDSCYNSLKLTSFRLFKNLNISGFYVECDLKKTGTDKINLYLVKCESIAF